MIDKLQALRNQTKLITQSRPEDLIKDADSYINSLIEANLEDSCTTEFRINLRRGYFELAAINPVENFNIDKVLKHFDYLDISHTVLDDAIMFTLDWSEKL